MIASCVANQIDTHSGCVADASEMATGLQR
jgi:hypothetical protein